LDLNSRWGEWLRVEKNVITVNHDATTGIGLIYLKASKVLKEPSYREIARKAGDLLVSGQPKHGGFPEELRLTSEGVEGVGNQGVLEDHATDRAIELLLQLFDATGKEKYQTAARKAIDFLVTAQYPSGAFPQRYPLAGNSYSRFYTINDGATSDPILRLINFYRRTGEVKYLAAAKRGGDWLLSAVLPDPTPGWAEQYDLNNEPTSARRFEPPGAGAETTYLAVGALIELYLATGDEKYLVPVPKAIKWLEALQLTPGGKCYRLYDMKTGKPLIVERDTGRCVQEVKELPKGEQQRWYMGPYFPDPPAAAAPVSVMQIWERLKSMGREKLLAQRLKRTGKLDIESGYGAFRTPEIATEEDRLALTEQVKAILDEQNPAGWWKGQRYGTEAITSSTFTRNAIKLIVYLEMSDEESARLNGSPKRSKGTPIRPMWTCGRPDPQKPGAGFPVLEQAGHVLVFAGRREAGAYNHHSQLARHRGSFHAMWSNHPHGEDGPGQRVLYAHSLDGVSWSPAVELFPPIQEVRPSEENGLVLTAMRWVVVNERLYAVAMCHANVGFENPDRTHRTDRRDREHPFRARRAHDAICRQVGPDAGTFGPVVPTGPNVPASQNPGLSIGDWQDEKVRSVGNAVREALCTPGNIPAWCPPGIRIPRGVDGGRLCEPTVYRTADGKYMMLLRDDAYSHRMYASLSADGQRWDAAVPTDIPDSPSLTTSRSLPDGTVLLIGNQMAPEFDNADRIRHYGRDPLMVAVSRDGYRFEKAFALRCGQQKWRTPRSEVHGRGGGAQYPSAVIHDGTLYVQHSMGKEDIWISSIPLSQLGLAL
jgi:hypothetical protein